jgi:hypothetical protein
MGISISHGNVSCSATSIGNLGTHLASSLGASDWGQISTLFDGNYDHITRIAPTQAKRTAAVLRRAASDGRMPGDFAGLARQIAESADRAAKAGQTWTWG